MTHFEQQAAPDERRVDGDPVKSYVKERAVDVHRCESGDDGGGVDQTDWTDQTDQRVLDVD